MNYGFQPQCQAQNYLPAQSDERIWVQNEQSAEAYLVAPNSFVRLWDATKPIFYEKRSDATGRPMPIEAYEYTRRKAVEASKTSEPTNEYKEVIEALTRRIEALEEEVNDAKSDANDSDV